MACRVDMERYSLSPSCPVNIIAVTTNASSKMTIRVEYIYTDCYLLIIHIRQDI